MTSVLPKPDVETLIWIARPPEDIWAYWYDVANETEWRGGVITAQWISDPLPCETEHSHESPHGHREAPHTGPACRRPGEVEGHHGSLDTG